MLTDKLLDNEEYGNDDGDGDENSEKLPQWDSFREIPSKHQSGSQGSVQFIDYSVRILKLLAFLVTFLAVVVGGVISKAAVLLVTSQLNPTQEEACLNAEDVITSLLTPLEEQRVLWTWVLLFILLVPELGTFIRAGRIVFFKLNKMPSLFDFSVVALMETCSAVGTAILVFEVLPHLDVIRGVMLTNAVCFVPSVLRLLSRDTNEPYGMYKMCVDAAAVFFQFTALIIWPLFEQSARMGFIAPALFLSSCGFWMTYIPNIEPKGKTMLAMTLRSLWNVKNKIINHNELYWTYLFISIWKMIIYFGSMLAIMAIQGYDLNRFFDLSNAAFQIQHFNGPSTRMIARSTLAVFEAEQISFDSGELDWLWVAMVATGGAYCCYIFSKFACKILIQEVGLALSNILVVPATIGLLVIFDKNQTADVCFSQYFLPPYLFWNTEITDYYIADKLAWVWIFWLASQCWVTIHIWFPQCKRLAPTEKIFTTPMYSAIFPDQSICMNRTMDEEAQSNEDEGVVESEDHEPRVIVCATMWHESVDEMLEMFKSIIRLDLDHCARKVARDTFQTAAAKNNYYNYETQIFFDDAFMLEKDGGSDYVINTFVRDMIASLPLAIREVLRTNVVQLDPPQIYPTPYGGRLVYKLPGGSLLTVHLKDKNKIRHRKRWSQCMYMYYLLGFKLMDTPMSDARKDLIAKNTYLLALDGDIDFQPKAVQLLVDLMKKNDNLGAACGRIHPVGSGMMAWYQVFEYAIGHWLQKATEHMIGCVLCSPGCFSLFRGKALMDDNVMKTYTKNCEAARHYVQYDQGEDRWLCTLLLQRGYRVEYSAASDAYTHCPEDFNEFYNQRRRWVPSTMANIMDLLGSYKRTIAVNGNISFPYIMYQTMLLGGTVLGPGTIFLMLVGAFVAAFKIDNWTSFYYNLIPIIVFMIVCLFLESKIQLMLALLISTVYGLVMMAVLVGILIQIQEDGPFAPSTLFLFIVAGEIIVAGLMHPQEVYCLPSGTIYYITIPSMYLLLIIYSVCNLNVVSWGTREVAEKKTQKQLEEEKREAEEMENKKKEAKKSDNPILAFIENFASNKGKESGSLDFSCAGLFRCMCCTQPQEFDEIEHLKNIGKSLAGVNVKLENIERKVGGFDTLAPSAVSSRRPTMISGSSLDIPNLQDPRKEGDNTLTTVLEDIEERDDLMNPYWIEDKALVGKSTYLTAEERVFWEKLIERYLKPIDENKKKQEKIAADLKELRDKVVLSFFMLNALFVTVVFLLQLNKDTIYINWPLGVKSNISYNPSTLEVEVSQDFLQLEPIGLVFVVFFALILVIQFTGMFLHRFETLCHLLSTTTILDSDESIFQYDKTIEDTKKDLWEDFKGEETLDEDVVSNRKTVHAIASDLRRDKKPAVSIEKRLSSVMGLKKDKYDEQLKNKSNRRSSYLRNSLLSSAPRNSTAMRNSVTQPNRAFSIDTITEEKE